MVSPLLEKRVEALEGDLNPPQRPELVLVYTKHLAREIEPLIPPNRDIRLVTLKFANEAAEIAWEEELMRDNKGERRRLNALLAGNFDGA
jgi:hypothetical protein